MSASHGQSLLRLLLSMQVEAIFVENIRPAWLQGMELDFFCEALGLAFEFQGGQHYTPVYGFAQMRAQRDRDNAKKRICQARGVRLVRVDAVDLTVSRFRCMMKQRGFGHVLKDKRHAKGFDRQATAYREALRQKHGCPTAHRRGSETRLKAMRAAFGQG